MVRVVVDTNIIAGAYFRDETDCANVLTREYNGEFVTVFSNDTTEEMLSVVKAYSLNNKLPLSKLEIVELFKKIVRLCRRSESIEPKTILNILKEDPTDNMFLECAVEGNAEFIVTKNLKHYKEAMGNIKNSNGIDIIICNPNDFISYLDGMKKVAVGKE
jgi:putative PIN family toxin of toxin-antitoxin system